MKKNSILSTIIKILLVVVFIMGVYLFIRKDEPVTSKQSQSAASSASTTTSSSKKSSSKQKTQRNNLPKVSSSDWELVLVNRDNITAEMNPSLTDVSGISVDSRIADNVSQFLAAAQAVDASEHLISGYRSVAYQEQLFNSYVQQEMASNANLTQAEAEEQVKIYSQPAGASEHQTGLAIDMSTVDSLNASDTTVAAKVQALAPEYGFVLRFPQGKKDATGVDYEDWHFRYVGKKSAKYMTENNLTLEEYLALLKENE